MDDSLDITAEASRLREELLSFVLGEVAARALADPTLSQAANEAIATRVSSVVERELDRFSSEIGRLSATLGQQIDQLVMENARPKINTSSDDQSKFSGESAYAEEGQQQRSGVRVLWVVFAVLTALAAGFAAGWFIHPGARSSTSLPATAMTGAAPAKVPQSRPLLASTPTTDASPGSMATQSQ